jgi:hypothetical protein
MTGSSRPLLFAGTFPVTMNAPSPLAGEGSANVSVKLARFCIRGDKPLTRLAAASAPAIHPPPAGGEGGLPASQKLGSNSQHLKANARDRPGDCLFQTFERSGVALFEAVLVEQMQAGIDQFAAQQR